MDQSEQKYVGKTMVVKCKRQETPVLCINLLPYGMEGVVLRNRTGGDNTDAKNIVILNEHSEIKSVAMIDKVIVFQREHIKYILTAVDAEKVREVRMKKRLFRKKKPKMQETDQKKYTASGKRIFF